MGNKHIKLFESFHGDKTVNVIIVSRRGILDNPIVVLDDTTAQAEFEHVAKELVGDDVSEINFGTDSQLDDLNDLLGGSGREVSWFVDIEVNDYINK